MGDFYEMFLGDAELAAPLLDIALTTRDKGKPDAVPMCGVPVHARDLHEAPRGARTPRRDLRAGRRSPAGRAGAAGEARGRRGRDAGAGGRSGGPRVRRSARSRRSSRWRSATAPGAAGLAVLDASTGASAPRAAAASEGPEALPAALLWTSWSGVGPRELLLPPDRTERRGRARGRLPARRFRPHRGRRAELRPATAPARRPGFECRATGASAARLRRCCATWRRTSPSRWRRSRACATTRWRCHGARRGDAGAPRAVREQRGSARARHPDRAHRRDRDAARRAPSRALARLSAADRSRGDRGPTGRRGERSPSATGRARGCARRCIRARSRAPAREGRAPTATPRDLGALRASLEALPGVCEALADERRRVCSCHGAATPPEALRARPPEPLPELVALLRARRSSTIRRPMARGSRGAGETGYIRAGLPARARRAARERAQGARVDRGPRGPERERSGIASLKVALPPGARLLARGDEGQLARVPEDYERKQTLANAERFTTARAARDGGSACAARASGPPRSSARSSRSVRGVGARARAAEVRRGGRRGGRARRPRRAGRGGAAGRLGPAGSWTTARPRDPRRAATPWSSRCCGLGRRGASCRTTPPSIRRGADPAAHRPQHVGQEHLPAPGRADRAAGADRELRAGRAARGSAWSIASSRGSVPRIGWRAASRPSWSRCGRPPTSWRRRRRAAS